MKASTAGLAFLLTRNTKCSPNPEQTPLKRDLSNIPQQRNGPAPTESPLKIRKHPTPDLTPAAHARPTHVRQRFSQHILPQTVHPHENTLYAAALNRMNRNSMSSSARNTAPTAPLPCPTSTMRNSCPRSGIVPDGSGVAGRSGNDIGHSLQIPPPALSAFFFRSTCSCPSFGRWVTKPVQDLREDGPDTPGGFKPQSASAIKPAHRRSRRTAARATASESDAEFKKEAAHRVSCKIPRSSCFSPENGCFFKGSPGPGAVPPV